METLRLANVTEQNFRNYISSNDSSGTTVAQKYSSSEIVITGIPTDTDPNAIAKALGGGRRVRSVSIAETYTFVQFQSREDAGSGFYWCEAKLGRHGLFGVKAKWARFKPAKHAWEDDATIMWATGHYEPYDWE